MSGFKRATVTISEEEYRRLHQADMKQRFRGHSRAKAKNTGQSADLSHALQQMGNRQRQLEQALSSLDHNLDQRDAEMMHDILAQNALWYESLATMIEDTASATDTSLVMLTQHFTDEMQREKEQHLYHMQSVIQRLDAYEQGEQAKAEAARHWLARSASFAEFIQAQFEHERFLPGRLSRIFGNLDLAQNNFAQGFFESSLQTSQQAFLQLSELHLELEQRIAEWQAAYQKTYLTILQIIADLDHNAKVNALGLEGEQLAEHVDLEYWTHGKYRKLVKVARELMTNCTQDQNRISAEELTYMHNEVLPVIRETFESIIYEARLNALNSQLRMNIAERALQALENHGFRLNEAGYNNKDMRAAFTANLENPDGSRVVIEVLPPEKTQQELTNDLIVITNHPYLKTEQEARLQWQELCRTLKEYDLNVSRPEVRAIAPGTRAEYVENPPLLNEPLIRTERQHNVR